MTVRANRQERDASATSALIRMCDHLVRLFHWSLVAAAPTAEHWAITGAQDGLTLRYNGWSTFESVSRLSPTRSSHWMSTASLL